MDNRDLLLECALRLFAARGYDAVGVQEIVEAAGVTKPTLYYYFGSKRGLLEALLGAYFAQLNQVVRDGAAYSGWLPGTLKHLTAALFAFARANPAFYRLQLALWFAPEQSEGFQVVTGLNRTQYDLIEALFQRAAQDHGNMRGRHHAYAATYLGMVNTYVGMALNGLASLDEKLVDQAVHQFQHGIYS
jgi:TetR/AcrR family transcriptional regulator